MNKRERNKQAEMRTDLIVLLAIERSLLILRDDLLDSDILASYLRIIARTKSKLLKKLKMSIPAIVQVPLMEDRFL